MAQPQWVTEACLELVKRLRFDQVQGLSLSGGILPDDPGDGEAIQAAVGRYIRERIHPLIEAIGSGDRLKAQSAMKRPRQGTMDQAVDDYYQGKRISRIVAHRRENEERKAEIRKLFDPSSRRILEKAEQQRQEGERRYQEIQKRYVKEFAKIMGRKRAREFVGMYAIGKMIGEEAGEKC